MHPRSDKFDVPMAITNSGMTSRRNKIASRFYLLAVMGSFAVAFLTPGNILSYPWADFLVKLAAMLIPNVANERFVGELAGVAQFHSMLRWALTPLAFLIWWKLSLLWSEEELGRREQDLYSKSRWLLIFVVIAIPTFVIAFWFSPFDSSLSRGERFHYGSRFGLGFLGAIIFLSLPVVILGWLKIVKDFRKWLLRRN